MSRQPQQQQQHNTQAMSQQKSSNRQQQQDSLHRSYMNPNFMATQVAAAVAAQQLQQKPKNVQQQSRQPLPIDFNQNGSQHSFNNHHMESGHHMSMTKKPSLLSGYHNPFSGADSRNDIIPGLSPLTLSGNLQARYYVPPSNQQNNNAAAAAVLAAAAEFNNTSSSDDKHKSSRTSSTNNMSILTNQPQRNSNQTPNFTQFSPAVLAAALGNSSQNSSQYNQLIQHQMQQFQQQQQMHNFQYAANLNEASSSSTASSLSTTPTFVKKEPICPQLIASVPTPSTTPGTSSSATSSAIASSTYVPQVEAISPTPEDQKENSNLQAIKEKICTEICKVEKDIASAQYQFDQLEKKHVNILTILKRN